MNSLNRDPEYLLRIGNFINSIINRLEFYVALFVVLTLVLQQVLNLDLSIVSTGFLLLLAVAYFFSAFKTLPEKEDSGINRFILKLLGFGSSIAVMGILFTISGWPGYEISLNSAGMMMIICIAAILFVKLLRKDSKVISKRIIIRICVFSVLVAFLFFTPKSTLIDLGIMKEVIPAP